MEKALKCIIERDRLGRVRYYPGDGVGVQGGPPLGTISEKAIVPHTDLYHFFVIGDYIESEDDYVILESIGKGTAVGRLSWYAGKRYTVFRMNDPDFVRLGKLATELASRYGRRHYDYGLYMKLFTWAAGYWAKEILTGHIPPRPVTTDMIPYKTDRDFICIELYFEVWKLVGRRIRLHGCAPVPAEVINAVNRGVLAVIDYHNGDPDKWREPRGVDRRPWAVLGRTAEGIPRDTLVALGNDGYVRAAPVVEPEISGGKVQAVALSRDTLRLVDQGGVVGDARKREKGPDFIARPKGQKRNKYHVYRQPFGYPIRLCDWSAEVMDGLDDILTTPADMTLKNFIYGTGLIDKGRMCSHCWKVLLADRTSVGMDNHGHGKGAPID